MDPAAEAPTTERSRSRMGALRIVLIVVIVAVGVVLAIANWDDYSEHLENIDAGWLTLAVVFLVLGNVSSAAVAAELLRSRGHRPDDTGVVQVVLISNVAKYIPGFVLQLATFYRLSRRLGLDARQSWLLWLETTWMNVVVAAAIGSSALLVAGGDIPWWLSVPVLMGSLAFATTPVRDTVLRLARIVPAGGPPLRGLQPRAAGLAALGVVALGFHGVALARGVGAVDVNWFEIVAALAGGWIFGLVLVIFPGGLGPREVAATALLAQYTDPDVAAVIVVLSRLASVLADLLAGVAAALLPDSGSESVQPPSSAAD